MIDNIIIFENTSVYSSSRSTRVLFPFDLKIKSGKILSIIGNSGSGKTTFLKLIVNFLRPESGWKIEGTIKKIPGLKIGWIAQNPSLQLFKNFVFEEFYPLKRHESENFLSDYGLGYLAAKRCCELSQGEKALVVFAAAMSKNVKLLVMDEVMVNLSSARRALLKKWLKNFTAAGGSAVTVEHTADMLDIADDAIYIDSGNIKSVTREFAREILAVDFSVMPSVRTNEACASDCLNVRGLSDSGIASTSETVLELNIKKGEFIGIKGDNGCGKTTLLNMLAGLVKPQKGHITLNGKKLNGLRSRLGKLSFVSHDPLNQLFGTTVAGEFGFTSRDSNPDDAGKLIRDFHLEQLSERRIHTLSYGEQQRLVLSVNLACGAEVLLLDEPTYGMDRENMRKFVEILAAEKQKGRTIVMASHDEALLNHLSDRIISI